MGISGSKLQHNLDKRHIVYEKYNVIFEKISFLKRIMLKLTLKHMIKLQVLPKNNELFYAKNAQLEVSNLREICIPLFGIVPDLFSHSFITLN